MKSLIVTVLSTALVTICIPAPAAVIHLNTDWIDVPSSGTSIRRALDSYDAPDQSLYWGINFGADDWLPWEPDQEDGTFYFAIFHQNRAGDRSLVRSGSANRLWTTGGFQAGPVMEDQETGGLYVMVQRFGDPVRLGWRSYIAEGLDGEYVPELQPWPFLGWNVDLSTDFETLATVLANPHYELTLVQGEIPEPSTWLLLATALPLVARGVRHGRQASGQPASY